MQGPLGLSLPKIMHNAEDSQHCSVALLPIELAGLAAGPMMP